MFEELGNEIIHNDNLGDLKTIYEDLLGEEKNNHNDDEICVEISDLLSKIKDKASFLIRCKQIQNQLCEKQLII